MVQARKNLAVDLELPVTTLPALRLKRGLSQAQLAAFVGTSQPHIAKIEAGATRLYFATATRIADALGVTLDALRPLIEIQEGSPDKPIKTLIEAS